MTRVMTWNIGSFSFLKFHPQYKHEYFQPNLNGKFVSEILGNQSPDIIFLQEVFDKEDLTCIPILKDYPYQKLIPTWYHEHGIACMSKQPIDSYKKHTFTVIVVNGVSYIPLHLHSFSAQKRLDDIYYLNKLITDIPDLVILGDTNIWQRKSIFLFQKDKQAYGEIIKNCIDITKDIISTSILGFSLDKVCTTKNININNAHVIGKRGKYMDHYPVVFDIL